ncbi:MAG: MFS transporter [Myxococcota bacterium]
MRERSRRVFALSAFVWAGESIYLLPYTLRRDYRGTLIEVLQLPDEAALGAIYSVFGALCLGAYVAGGWLADRVSPRVLLPFSLALTAIGGGILATFPTSPMVLYALFALWAFSTILTFWAALIKATRAWGGDSEQGRAFGLLDGGRGLVAAVAASVGLQLFAAQGGGATGLRAVIALYTAACLIGAVATWFAVPGGSEEPEPPGERTDASSGAKLRAVLRLPNVWLLGGVIFCAYTAYYGTFYFAGFAMAAHGQSAAGGAAVSVASGWLRALVPVVAGLSADRASSRNVIVASFAVLVVAFASMAALRPEVGGIGLLYVQAATIAAAAFALRGVYYALLEEGGLPTHLTGTAVGVVALIGYTPDVLTPYLWGVLLDARPGAAGYRTLFGSLAVSSLLGAFLAALHRRKRRSDL